MTRPTVIADPTEHDVPLPGTPFEKRLRAAGARFTSRGGSSVAADFGSASTELAVCRRAVGIVDVSQLGKLAIDAPISILATFVGQGDEPLAVGEATHTIEGWWCRVAPRRLMAITPPALTARVHDRLEQSARRRPASTVTDETESLAALGLVGPRASQLCDRLSGDLLTPEQPTAPFVRSTTVAAVATMVLREAADRFILLFDARSAGPMWDAVLAAGEPLGASCVGTSALRMLDAAARSHRDPVAS